MKQTTTYQIDLTKITGEGDFSCPKCGTRASPDDLTERAYSITETKVGNQGLEGIVVRCKKCESDIYLTGFSFLNELDLP